MKIDIEIRYQTIIGAEKPTLDEVVMQVDDKCLFHLEQMSDQGWWMGIGDPKDQYVHVNLTTRRAIINGFCEDEGTNPPRVIVNGIESCTGG